VTELILRDAHQSLLATRMALEDMLPACADIDAAGYWSSECWGGATSGDAWGRLEARVSGREDARVPFDAAVEGQTRQLQSEGELARGWTGAHEDVDARP
jgi:hypothetical protein